MECRRVKHHSIEVVAHQELTEADLAELRELFHSEYLAEFEEWDPRQPYGYESHDWTAGTDARACQSVT